MNQSRSVVRYVTILTVAAVFVSCGNPTDSNDADVAPSSPTTSPVADSTAEPTTPEVVASTTVVETTTPPDDPAVMAAFQREVADHCNAVGAAIAELPDPDGTMPGVDAQLAELAPGGTSAFSQVSVLDSFVVPEDQQAALERTTEIAEQSDAALTAALAAQAAGDVPTADAEIDAYLAKLNSIAGSLAVMGASCLFADADHAAAADLNVQLDLGAEQIAEGFGSIWASQSLGGNIVRFDPDTGEILATIDVGSAPLKAQPANGRMWVRTRDAYVGIDAESNTVTATILKSDVGPDANRSWATDGSMWICDGNRLHRYNPATLQPETIIELDIACDAVYATDELVVAWSYNDNPGAVADPAAAMIDPATNTVLATIDLPVEVLAPAVLDDTVFFTGNFNPTGVIIDRNTWSITSTVDLGRQTHGSNIVTDGKTVFAPTNDAQGTDVLVIDATTFDVVDTIHPIAVNALAVENGSLWTTSSFGNVAQRFDYAE